MLFICLEVHAVGIGMGTYVPSFARYQDEVDGSKDHFQFNPYFSLTTYFPLFNEYFLAPEIGMAFHTGTEDEYSKRTMVFLWHGAYRFSERMLLRFGVGTFWTRISGDGEEVQLPDGSGTATFYAPTESSTSYTSSLDIGIEYVTGPQWGARADVFLQRAFSGDRRTFAYLLSMVFVP
ncbi:MAG: hypothetical protein CME71_12310 [Halobacteriovorax sp.]|nr:hypothetical protein [Halobacteriovorax sp.]